MCNRLPEINKNGDAGIFPVYYSLKQTSHYGGNQYRTHFKRLFITRSIRKNVDVQLYAKKYP